MRLFIIIIFLNITGFKSFAQQNVLTLPQLFDIVQSYHPVARQAAMQIEMAKADILIARGAFDPVLQTNNSRKELESVVYYHQSQYELKIPLWYGIDIYTGLESITGSKLNPIETKGNSSYVGFSVPIVKNLLIDKRRAVLKQANIFQNLSVAEQQNIVNNLLQDAAKAYWTWWEQYTAYQLFATALNNAEKRMQMVRVAFQLGDRPAIDTLEAMTQLQSFVLKQNEINIQLNNARLELSVYLWQKDDNPYELPHNVVPEKSAFVFPDELYSLESLLKKTARHPQLQQYDFKLEALGIEKRLKFQSLLPSVYAKYNQLNKSHDIAKTISSPWLENNYRYGITLSMPLRLSEGRGEYRKAKLKIEQTRMEQMNKQVVLENKVKQYHYEWQQLQQQVELQAKAVNLLQTMQRGEEVKFFNGESSLFIINSREAKTLEAQQKLIEYQTKHQKAAVNVLWIAGLLPAKS